MNTDIFDIDHLMLNIADSAQAVAVFSRMGFTITPRGQLPGLSNYLMCFGSPQHDRPNFVELMSLDDAKKAPPPMVKALSGPDRPVLMVAASANAENTRSQLKQSGLDVSPVIEGERDWTLPTGEVLDLSFSIVLPDGGQAPFYWIACQHKTPQHYLRPDFTSHDNEAIGMTTIIAVANAPLEAARHYERYWGAEAGKSDEYPGLVVVSQGRVQLCIHSQDSFADTYPGVDLSGSSDKIVGFAVQVADQVSLGKKLEENGFEPVITDKKVIVKPEQACGCLVVFEGEEE